MSKASQREPIRAVKGMHDLFEGDLVTWRLPTGLPHIGIVTDRRSDDGARPLIAHNIGNGSTLEDMLFEFPITGHYRYGGPVEAPASEPASASPAAAASR